MPKGIPSPYIKAEPTLGFYKAQLLKHLDTISMPKPIGSDHDCVQDCHVIERNHTIEIIKHYIEGVDNLN